MEAAVEEMPGYIHTCVRVEEVIQEGRARRKSIGEWEGGKSQGVGREEGAAIAENGVSSLNS